jgi:hypothetical protein
MWVIKGMRGRSGSIASKALMLYSAAISEYDQKLLKNLQRNGKMVRVEFISFVMQYMPTLLIVFYYSIFQVEAMDLFEEICNNIFFSESSIMIYLNKRDLFEAKMKVKNIRDIDIFSDYSGRDNNYDDGVQYFVDKFLSKNKSGSARQIYYHVTCATDTENVSRVFNACKEIVLRQNIKKSVLS